MAESCVQLVWRMTREGSFESEFRREPESEQKVRLQRRLRSPDQQNRNDEAKIFPSNCPPDSYSLAIPQSTPELPCQTNKYPVPKNHASTLLRPTFTAAGFFQPLVTFAHSCAPNNSSGAPAATAKSYQSRNACAPNCWGPAL